MLVYLMFNNDVEFIMNDLIRCHSSFEINYVTFLPFDYALIVKCYLTLVVVLVDRLPICMNG